MGIIEVSSSIFDRNLNLRTYLTIRHGLELTLLKNFKG